MRMQCRFGPFHFDAANAQLSRDGQPLPLRPKSFDVLAYLVAHAGELVTTEELLDTVWADMAVGDAVVRVSVRELRKLFGETSQAPTYIETVHRRGYRFIAPVLDVLESDLPPSPLPVAPQPPAHADAPPQPILDPAIDRPSLPAVERRQLTILFCDLVGSTSLSMHLDPEELQDILLSYRESCADVINGFGGYLAQYMGDGILVYFGYPDALEDSARRAVHSGLGILDAMATLTDRLQLDHDIRLAVRVGIETGLVVVGQRPDQDDPLAMGSTPNLAARIQALAGPDTIWVGPSTYSLIQGYFITEDMGRHSLPGVAAPLELYQVTGVSQSQHRLDVAAPSRLVPFVGREMERLVLHQHWEQVQSGQGRVVILSGEAGIGKSRLARALVETVSTYPHILLEGHCSPYHQHTAFYPLIDLLRRHLQIDPQSPAADNVDQLAGLVSRCQLDASQCVPLLAALLSLHLPADQYPGLEVSPEQQRQRTLDTLLNLVVRLSEVQPVLLFIEDGHWLDPSTLEWLGLLVDQGPTTSILTLVTCRPAFQPDWSGREHVTRLPLTQLTEPQVTQMIESMSGGEAVAAELVSQVVSTTDGVPLYVEEITRLLLESNLGTDSASAPPAFRAGIAVPTTLQDLLMARLDSVGDAKRTAQLGATIGREFSYDLLQAVSTLETDQLHQDLETLLASDLLYQRGVGPDKAYRFKHALIQEAAYGSQLRRTRQSQHQHLAQVLEASSRDGLDGALELIAYHYTEAGDTPNAVTFWLRAGERAAQRSAHREAVAHFRQGLMLLEQLPESVDRTRQELILDVALGRSIYTVQGFADPEVEQIHLRARALCEQLGDTERLYIVLRGLVIFYANRGPFQSAETIASEILAYAEQQAELGPRMLGHYSLSLALMLRGKIHEAKWHSEQALALYEAQDHRHLVYAYGIDVGAVIHSCLALSLWLLGHPDQALEQGQLAVGQAHESGHAFTLMTAQTWLTWLHHFRRDPDGVQDSSAKARALSDEQGFALYDAFNRGWEGWALAQQGEPDSGMTLLQEAMTKTRQMGTQFLWPYHLAIMAELLDEQGASEEGVTLISEAIAGVEPVDGYWWEAELYRLQGELRWRQSASHAAQAESCYRQALEVSRSQKAKALELRAAMSLSRLWQHQGKRVDAHTLLADVYDRLTEGFETPDLRDAKALIDTLSGAAP